MAGRQRAETVGGGVVEFRRIHGRMGVVEAGRLSAARHQHRPVSQDCRIHMPPPKRHLVSGFFPFGHRVVEVDDFGGTSAVVLAGRVRGGAGQVIQQVRDRRLTASHKDFALVVFGGRTVFASDVVELLARIEVLHGASFDAAIAGRINVIAFRPRTGVEDSAVRTHEVKRVRPLFDLGSREFAEFASRRVVDFRDVVGVPELADRAGLDQDFAVGQQRIGGIPPLLFHVRADLPCVGPRIVNRGVDHSGPVDEGRRAMSARDKQPAVWKENVAGTELVERRDVGCFRDFSRHGIVDLGVGRIGDSFRFVAGTKAVEVHDLPGRQHHHVYGDFAQVDDVAPSTFFIERVVIDDRDGGGLFASCHRAGC